ncbi:hypothetical protein Tco_0707674 [Tanacetum coccineum]|uniref:Retrotransposon gag domain-containing protein n=1 Tax=Tanacetum coccineum TaxID=301880 RepID=A0ABQ4YAZ1_9ASTR
MWISTVALILRCSTNSLPQELLSTPHCRFMHENFYGTKGAVGLTRWFEKLESQFGISNVAEGDRVKFASSTLLDGALTWWNVNEVKQMENELWNLKVKGTNLTAYNQRFQELILLCPEMVPNADRSGLMRTNWSKSPGKNTGDKRGNHYNHNPNNTNNTSNLNSNKRPETARVFTAGQDIRPKTVELHIIPQTKEDQEANEDREVMSLVSDVAKKDITKTSVQTMGIKVVGIKFEATRKTLRIIKGKIKETLKEVTKH